MPLADDLADVLSSGGLGTVGTTIFCAGLPWTPDAAIGILETPGYGAIHTMSTGPGHAVMVRPRAQVTFRDTDYASARLTAWKAWALLDGQPERTINGVAYHYITAVQEPGLLEFDENDRPVFVMNLDVMREFASSS